MISAGKTAEIKVGRQILCKEKTNMRATSACAKKLTATVNVAKKGLTAKQQKLWQKYVYTPAVLNAERFSKTAQRIKRCRPWDVSCMKRMGGMTKAKAFKLNVKDILAGKLKFKGLFGKKFKWADFLINGAKMIKKLPPKFQFTPGVPK